MLEFIFFEFHNAFQEITSYFLNARKLLKERHIILTHTFKFLGNSDAFPWVVPKLQTDKAIDKKKD